MKSIFLSVNTVSLQTASSALPWLPKNNSNCLRCLLQELKLIPFFIRTDTPSTPQMASVNNLISSYELRALAFVSWRGGNDGVPRLWLLQEHQEGKSSRRSEPRAGGGGLPRAVRFLLLQGSLASEP